MHFIRFRNVRYAYIPGIIGSSEGNESDSAGCFMPIPMNTDSAPMVSPAAKLAQMI